MFQKVIRDKKTITKIGEEEKQERIIAPAKNLVVVKKKLKSRISVFVIVVVVDDLSAALGGLLAQRVLCGRWFFGS